MLFLSCSFQNQNLFSQAADAFKLAIHLLRVLCKTGLGLNLCAPLVRRSLVLWFHFQSNFINLQNVNKFSGSDQNQAGFGVKGLPCRAELKLENGRIKVTKNLQELDQDHCRIDQRSYLDSHFFRSIPPL